MLRWSRTRNLFNGLGSWVCMGLNSAFDFLGRFHRIDLACLLFCLSAFVRRLHFIGLEFWPFPVFKDRSQDGNCCLWSQASMENDLWSTSSVGGRCLGQTNKHMNKHTHKYIQSVGIPPARFCPMLVISCTCTCVVHAQWFTDPTFRVTDCCFGSRCVTEKQSASVRTITVSSNMAAKRGPKD